MQFKVSTNHFGNNAQKCRGQRSISSKGIRTCTRIRQIKTLSTVHSRQILFLCANSQMHDTFQLAKIALINVETLAREQDIIVLHTHTQHFGGRRRWFAAVATDVMIDWAE
jgi:hypothetical protein